MLADDEYAKWSDREIAKHCGVSHSFVATVRDGDAAKRQVANRAISAAKAAERSGVASTREGEPSGVASTQPAQQVESDSTLAAGITATAPANDAQNPSEPVVLTVAKPEYTHLDALRDQIDELQQALALSQSRAT